MGKLPRLISDLVDQRKFKVLKLNPTPPFPTPTPRIVFKPQNSDLCFISLASPATLIPPPTLTVQVKQNKPLRSLDAVKQKCARAVNTVGRRLCKQADLVLRRTVCGRPFPVWVPLAAAATPSSRADTAVVAAGEGILITLSRAEQPHAHDESCMSAPAQASVRDLLNNIVGINVCRSRESP